MAKKLTIKQMRKVLRDAEKHPKIMRTWDFIESRLRRVDLSDGILEMGPNCNLACPHCATECSPIKKGFPSPETTYNLFRQANKADIEHISLSDGEPMRPENRESVGIASRFSHQSPCCIMTNGVFASTLESAEEWFEFLKQNNFDFRSGRSILTISFGKTYSVPVQNYQNINQAIANILPKEDPGVFLNYKLINLGDGLDNVNRANAVLRTIYSAFGKPRRHEYLVYNKNHFRVRAYPGKGKSIKMYFGSCDPIGRARNLDLFNGHFKKREFTSNDLFISTSSGKIFIVFNNGDIDICNSSAQFSRENSYGNVNHESLIEILNRIRRDKVFQAYKLAGTPFVYYLAQQVDPEFRVTGKVRQDVTSSVLGSSKKRGQIREYLKQEGLIETYMRFAHFLDLRKRPKS